MGKKKKNHFIDKKNARKYQVEYRRHSQQDSLITDEEPVNEGADWLPWQQQSGVYCDDGYDYSQYPKNVGHHGNRKLAPTETKLGSGDCHIPQLAQEYLDYQSQNCEENQVTEVQQKSEMKQCKLVPKQEQCLKDEITKRATLIKVFVVLSLVLGLLLVLGFLYLYNNVGKQRPLDNEHLLQFIKFMSLAMTMGIFIFAIFFIWYDDFQSEGNSKSWLHEDVWRKIQSERFNRQTTVSMGALNSHNHEHLFRENAGNLHYQDICTEDTLRAEATQHAELRKEYFQKAAEARRQNKGALAKHYDQQGRLQTRKMEDANSRAVKMILSKNSDEIKLDLHGLHVKEALEAVEERLAETRTDCLYIITGRGSHSIGGVAKIKPAVLEYLERKQYCHEIMNEGQILVKFYEK